MLPASITAIANEPNAMRIAETSTSRQPKPAREDYQSTCPSGTCIGSADHSDTSTRLFPSLFAAPCLWPLYHMLSGEQGHQWPHEHATAVCTL